MTYSNESAVIKKNPTTKYPLLRPCLHSAAKRAASLGVTMAMLMPSAPWRAVRPERWMYVSAEAGIW